MDPGKASRKELMEISFRPAKGGLISETRHKLKGGDDYMSDRETAVHPNIGHAMKHMKEAMGGGGMKKKEESTRKGGASIRKG